MAKSHFRKYAQILSPYLIVIGSMTFGLGMAQNVFANYFAGVSFWRSLVLLGVPLILLGVLLPLLVPTDIKATITPRTLRTEDEKKRNANRGLIVFVSLYRPIKGAPPAGAGDKQWLDAAGRLDYRSLDLENSNLGTAINAVVGHAPKLEHCWLIGTTSTDPAQPGSLDYEPVLIRFLTDQKKLTCEFHSGPEYAIPLDDDALVCPKTYDLVKRIYKRAKEEHKIETGDMIADFTGCPRSMTLGLILACLSTDQNIQLMGTRYDGSGRPVGPAIPIIFTFEPRLQAKP